MPIIALGAASVAFAGDKNTQSASATSGTGTLTFLTAEMPPFGVLKDGKPVGFAVEILHEIMQRLGRTDTIEFDDWKVIYKRALAEPNTVLMPPSRTPEREELFKWVGPLIPEKLVLFARKDSGLVINSLEDAKKAGGIATVTGYASERLLKENGFTNLVSQRSSIQGPDALKFGRVDLWFNSNITMEQTAVAANVDPDLFEPLFVVKEIPSYLAFSKSVPDEVVNKWQSTLDDMKRDGTWERIVSRWIPADLRRIGGRALNLSEKERLWVEAHPTVKVVQYFHQPPFNLDKRGSHTGYLYALLYEVLHVAGLKAEFVGGFSSYDSMIDALQNGSVDILTNVNSTRRLPGNIVRTVPVVKTPNVVVAKVRVPEITRTSDLFGSKVAVVKGYAQDQHLDKFPSIEKVHVKNNEEGFEAVRMGRVEYFLNNMANAVYVLNKTFATDLQIAGTLSYVDFPPLSLSFGVHGKDSPLPGIINKALEAVPAHTLSELRNTWLPEASMAMDTNNLDLTPEEQAFLNAHPVVRVHNEQDWAPINFNENGVPSGFSIDHMDLLAKKIGIKVEYISGPSWNEFITMIKQHDLDVMLNIVNTEERRKFLRFTSEPNLEPPRAMVVRKDDTSIRNFGDLSGKTVVVEKGFFYEEYLRQNHPEINIMTVKNTSETLKVVANGDADATLGIILVEQFLINKHFYSNLKLVMDPEAKALRSYNHFIAVRDDWPLLASILDKAEAKVTDEERVALSRRWMGQGGAETKRVALSTEEYKFLREHPVLRVAFDVDWPPVEFSDKKLGMNGIAADYLNRMSELLGVKFKPSRPRSWKEMMEAVEGGELDFFSAISPTPQRREWLDFTSSYLSFPIVIITGKEVPYIGSMTELRSKPVAVVDGYASHDLLLSNHPDLSLLPMRGVKEGLLAVSTGQAFAFVGSLAAASHVMSREGLTDLKVSGETPYSFDIAMGAAKDNTVLLGILDKALASISPQERNAIHSRWTSVTYEHAIDYSLIWRIGIGALLIFALVLYWNGRLQKEIAERKRAEKNAEAANRAKSEFLANMSHELRTPLNAVIGFANIMAKSEAHSPEDQKNLNIIIRNGEHLLKLINDILNLSRIEAGKVGLTETDFDLHKLLDDLKLMFEQKIQEKDLQLTFNRKPDVAQYIRTDQVKLRQVLINLIGNAIKFTERGGITVTVGLQPPPLTGKQEPRSVTLHFEVQDTGPGVAPEEIDNVFAAFGQTAIGRQAQEGTGLGLPLSRKFVPLMGGNMHLSSEVGQGSSFSFDVRAKVVGRSDMIEAAPARNVIALAPGQTSYRMLIVDDSLDNRQLLVAMLAPLGFELQEAIDGQEAVDIYEDWRPHIVWMDIRMPVMDGLEATKRILAMASQTTPPIIIAVTASVFEDKQAMVLSAGCNDYLRKPFMEADIFEMLHKHLGIKFMYEEKQKAEAGKKKAEGKESLAPGALAALPAQWLDTLKQGARRADILLLSSVIEEIRGQDAGLADALAQLAEDFKYDEILALLAQTDQDASP